MVDVVVVGAGAAGIGASRKLRAAGLEVIVLEAKDRVGGRAHSARTAAGAVWDRGAHWLHNAEHNPMRAFADALGFRYRRGARRLVIRDRDGPVDSERQTAIEDHLDRGFAAVAEAGARGEDRPASEVVPDHPEFGAMFESLFAAFNGVEPARMSTLDYARSVDGKNWPVIDGYGALLARVAADEPVRTGSAVHAITVGRDHARISTARGALEAAAVLVTVSTAVLASGAIEVDPPLPEDLRAAAHALPLGEANKVALSFTRNVFGDEEPHFIAFEHRDLATIRFDVRPLQGRPLAVGYFGGGFAREIEAAGDAAMKDFAVARLTAAFGNDLRRHVAEATSTAWCSDAEIRGGYSCARPGQADARRAFDAPVHGRIFFAGEACSVDAYGTVHGAWQSGEAAATRIIRTLRVSHGHWKPTAL